MKKILLISICCLILITGCKNNSNYANLNNNQKNNTITQNNDNTGSDEIVSDIKVIINDKNYILKLENNKTSEEFIKLIPKEYTMNELNGNEKYVYLDNSLTNKPYNPKYIQKGDVMLFGDNCLVIFYKSFDTSYSYTKIGHIENLDDLGRENIIIKFEK